MLNILKFTNDKIKDKIDLLTVLSITKIQADDISIFIPTNLINHRLINFIEV